MLLNLLPTPFYCTHPCKVCMPTQVCWKLANSSAPWIRGASLPWHNLVVVTSKPPLRCGYFKLPHESSITMNFSFLFHAVMFYPQDSVQIPIYATCNKVPCCLAFRFVLRGLEFPIALRYWLFKRTATSLAPFNGSVQVSISCEVRQKLQSSHPKFSLV
jgi:hypothetical protein